MVETCFVLVVLPLYNKTKGEKQEKKKTHALKKKLAHRTNYWSVAW